MSEHDRNFDDLTSLMARNIYDTPKGQIRLAVLWQHLCEQLPELKTGRSLRILDAGCGMGQLSRRLLEQGHHLTLCDLSNDMLAAAQQSLADVPHLHPVQYIHAPLQDLAAKNLPAFDLVLCHAVLEWLVEPREALLQLRPLLKANGYLSLMYYNCHSLVFRNLVRGNLRKVASGRMEGEPGGLTPTQPLYPQDVLDWLMQAGLEVVSSAGIRTFYDYMATRERKRISLADLIEMEIRFSQQEPYRAMARYQHLLCRAMSG